MKNSTAIEISSHSMWYWLRAPMTVPSTYRIPGKRKHYYRPCLALDLAERIPQLRALLAEAEWAIENPNECPLCGRTDDHVHDGDTLR